MAHRLASSLARDLDLAPLIKIIIKNTEFTYVYYVQDHAPKIVTNRMLVGVNVMLCY